MSFASLAVIMLVSLAGPLLAARRGWHLPIVLGELLVGIALGTTGTGYLNPLNPSFVTLADIGFALVMFVAGTHVPLRDPGLHTALGAGLLRAMAAAAVAVALAAVISSAFHAGHFLLYAVLMASSSAALILPIVDSLSLKGTAVLELMPQVAISDAACIVALPLVIDQRHAGRAALGALSVITAAAILFVVLRWLENSGWRRRVHRVSEERRFAVELRVSLAALFALAALAVSTHVSILLAGFSFGLAVSAVGPPRRLARQLFALTEGFLGPVFFVWLGASLNLRDLGSHPRFILIGALLGFGACASHLLLRGRRQPLSFGLLASAQLGVPVAAATIGTQLHVLAPGEPAALIMGALITIAAAVIGGSLAGRAGFDQPGSVLPPVSSA
ncbi:cation:proton antiporter [Jatrophihabitans sp. DSM 45814]